MADTTTEQCPNCGHLTTGKKESHGILGAVAGGVSGGAAGHSNEYHFCCSKCGHSWWK